VRFIVLFHYFSLDYADCGSFGNHTEWCSPCFWNQGLINFRTTRFCFHCVSWDHLLKRNNSSTDSHVNCLYEDLSLSSRRLLFSPRRWDIQRSRNFGNQLQTCNIQEERRFCLYELWLLAVTLATLRALSWSALIIVPTSGFNFKEISAALSSRVICVYGS
jgi:hypothetical protein